MNIEHTILAGDVGGTKTLLALFSADDGKPVEIKSKEYKSDKYNCLEEIINDFLKNFNGTPPIACLGIAGPVNNGVEKSTNLPWITDEKTLSKKTGIRRIKIINDLAATAHSITHLTSDEIINIKPGVVPKMPERFVVLAPGTGLGQSFLIQKRNKIITIPSEGGHVDFAPANEIEAELYIFLFKKFGHVSYERIISGIGLPNIFDYLVQIKKMKPEKETIEKMKNHDKAPVISELALSGKDSVCEEALNLFVSVLGSHAGNLALTFLADGGVYLAGGIPFKILPKLKEDIFTKSFLNKGRLSSILEPIPVNLISNNRAAVKGAAYFSFQISE